MISEYRSEDRLGDEESVPDGKDAEEKGWIELRANDLRDHVLKGNLRCHYRGLLFETWSAVDYSVRKVYGLVGSCVGRVGNIRVECS